jgi:hypothetical protein
MTQFSDILIGGRFTLIPSLDATPCIKYASDSECKGYGSYQFDDGDIFPRAPYLCADWCEIYPIN